MWRGVWERHHLEDLGLTVTIILKQIFKKWDWAMKWIDLTLARDRWRALLKAVMNFRVP
jgi:hypothetical protein